jgi:hypothetical protein
MTEHQPTAPIAIACESSPPCLRSHLEREISLTFLNFNQMLDACSCRCVSHCSCDCDRCSWHTLDA